MENLNPSKKSGRREALDKLMKEGHLQDQNLPGTDTFDDGLDERGRLKPGSTTVGSGGNYMEDAGPQDLKHTQTDPNAESARQSGLRQLGDDEVMQADDMYAGEDPAAKWLRENDPEWRKKNGLG